MPFSRNTLESCQFLNQLPDNIQQKICLEGSSITVPAGTILFDDGDESDKLALVISGSIRVYKRSTTGREVSLYRVNQNNLCIVTLSCLLGCDTYPATAQAEEDTTLIALPRLLFLSLVAGDESFRLTIFNQFAQRVTGLMQLVDEITFNKLDQRLATLLLSHGPVIRQSHQAIADELGSVREIISRILKQFEKNGWVRLSREQVEILEPQAIEELT